MSAEHAAAAAPTRTSYWLRKAHSLSGVVPVGVFLCMHLFENASAANGPEAFRETVQKINSMPFILPMEILGIWLPLAFHAAFGMVIVFEGKPNAAAYPYGRNWLYVMQRVTGVVALGFIVYHFMNFRARKAEFMADPYGDVHATLSNTWVFAWYVVGIASCVFHFANGMAGFLFSWGLTVGPRAKRLAGLACAGLGFAVFALGMRALFAFR
jgi:succinate dehydrogenase/fumarate reductase cytochrome b subunit (b558 family)